MYKLEDGIEQPCKFTSNFSSMDTIFIDSASKIKLKYASNNTPAPLTPYFINSIDMLKLHETNSEFDVIFHTNSYRINYISAKLFDGTEYIGSIIVGPYLLEEPTILMIEAIISENNMAISLKSILNQYYLSLPMISTYKAKITAEFLAYITATLETNCFHNSKIGNLTYDFKTEYAISSEVIKGNTEKSMEALEERYKIENALLYAVETGNKEALYKLNSENFFTFREIADRVPNDPLRSRKNLSFVLNTLLRKAAQNGGVHPIYTDSISEKFAIKIEKCTTIQQLYDLQSEMMFEYCDSVRMLSLKNFSPLIRKAIEYIRINLNQDLSLEYISSALRSSPYELSRQFKKETGEGITEYINKNRIKEALYILENQNISITDTAYIVGFNDVNYFTKVFKKIKGITPSEFRKIKKKPE